MTKESLKFLLPGALAVVLLVVLQAQNPAPAPASPPKPVLPGTSPVPATPTPRKVALPGTSPAPAAGANPIADIMANAKAAQTLAQNSPGAAAAPPAVPPAGVIPPSPVPAPAATAEAPIKPPGVVLPNGGAAPVAPAAAVPPAVPATPGTRPAATASPAGIPLPPALNPNGTPAKPASASPVTRPGAVPTLGTNATGAKSEIADQKIEAIAEDINLIIDRYEVLTGRLTIRDASLQGTLTVKSSRMMTKTEAIDFLKTSLLLNGWAIVPAGKGIDKVLPWQGKFPTIEQHDAPVYSTEADLPEDEQIVNYVMYLEHISPDEASRTFQTALPMHQPYGKITAVPNAGALIITENTPSIRLALQLKKKIDVAAEIPVKEFFQLERADAADVEAIIKDILTAQSNLRNKQGSTTTGTAGPRGMVPQAPQNLPAGLAASLPNAGGNTGTSSNVDSGRPPDDSSVMVKAIPRTNEVLISGRKSDIAYIRDLIKELDKEAKVKSLQRFQLRFLRVEDFLAVAGDAITRGLEDAGSGGGGGGAAGSRSSSSGGRSTSGVSPFGGGSSGGSSRASTSASGSSAYNANSNGFGGSSGFGGGTSGSRSGRSSGGGIGGGGGGGGGGGAQVAAPSSQIVGKTLLISDPRSNSLLVAGQPEHIKRVEELVREMDKRPLQVSITAVIGQVNLDDSMEHGFDLVRRVQSVNVGGTNVNIAGGLRGFTTSGTLLDPGTLDNLGNIPALNGLGLYAQVGELFNAYVKELETTSRFQIISRPFIFTANNVPASISVGQQVPYASSTYNGGTSTGFQSNTSFNDVNLDLFVTPLINSKDEVTLTIEQTNNTLGAGIKVGENTVNTINTQSLSTEVSVPNGGVVVVGGLIKNSDDGSKSGVPFITRIPILGALFGNTTNSKSRNEVLIFIQPRIVETSDELTAMQADQLRSTVVGKRALEVAQPKYNMDDVVLPTDQGDVKWNDADHLLPAPGQVPAEHPAKALPMPAPTKSDRSGPSIVNLETAETEVTVPGLKKRQAFWEKTPEPAAPSAPPAKPAGLKKLLPWNWGKEK